MSRPASALDPVFRLSDRIALVPVVHGSGDCSVAVRRMMLEYEFDCLAVPLPPSHQSLVEEGIRKLPRVSAILQHPGGYRPADWGVMDGRGRYVNADLPLRSHRSLPARDCRLAKRDGRTSSAGVYRRGSGNVSVAFHGHARPVCH